MGGIIWPMQPGWGGVNPFMMSGAQLKENIPEGDVALESGTAVECTDGHAGRIDRVLVDDDTKEMTGFVIRRGFRSSSNCTAFFSGILNFTASGHTSALI